MRRATTVVLAAAASLPLCFALSAPASAAPGDVTFSVEAVGNTVVGTFTFANGVAPTYCGFGDRTGFDNSDPNDLPLYVEDYRVTATTTLTLTDFDVPDGVYTVDWACHRYSEPAESWGTPTDMVANGPTAVPVTLTVPAAPVDPVDPGCTGSVCLPTGSFGF